MSGSNRSVSEGSENIEVAETQSDMHDHDNIIKEETLEEEEEEAHEEVAEANASATEINEKTFDQLRLPADQVAHVQEAWQTFIRSSESREAAGEAIYSALFEAAPSLQSLFKTPRAVMAMRFMAGIQNIINVLNDPVALKITVETLGFQHLDLEVTAPRVAIFRNAIVDLIQMEIGQTLTTLGKEGLQIVLSWVGGAYIYIRLQYADRLRILARSWAKVNNASQEDADLVAEEEEADKKEATPSEGENAVVVADRQDDVEELLGKGNAGTQKKSLWSRLGLSKGPKEPGSNAARAASAAKEGQGSQNGSMSMDMRQQQNMLGVPRTYEEMFRFNATVMGFAGSTWMNEVLLSFDTIVRNASNSYRLTEECDVLSLRLAKCTKGNTNLGEYKNVMLASLRSLLPKDWNSAHEVAWSWLWENVERMLKTLLGKPAAQERALEKFLTSLGETQLDFFRREVYAQFFVIAPAGQDYFKQSTTRLYFIADKVASFTIEMYQDPRRMVEDLSALGLRHVGFGIPTELFGPFVDAVVNVVRKLTKDPAAEEALRWSITLVSRILVRAINEGSTVVMKAINANSARALRQAVACAPRGKRAAWMLNITVGTQSISPLVWSIESGALEASRAILKDLMTIRADRDRYYFGADELFDRHPDIVKIICQDAPTLLSNVLDGLVWRSRIADRGTRRVNYYIKHLLLDKEGAFSPALRCIADLRDPKLACHPILVFLSDLLWGSVSFRRFMIGRVWLLFTIAVFVLSQAVLRFYAHQTEHQWARPTVFGIRMFIYTCSMGELWFTQTRRTIKDFREGDTTKVGIISIPTRYVEDYQEVVSLALATFLALMLSHCPVLYCMGHQNEDFQGHGDLTETCPTADSVLKRYSVFSMTATLLYFIRILDLAVCSNRLCAYVLMCGHVLPEVFIFLLSLVFVIVAFSCAVGSLAQEVEQFSNIPMSSLSFLEISFLMFDPNKFEDASSAGWLYACIVAFIIFIAIYLINLLIAQITTSFQQIFLDMVGFARIRRIAIICNTMPLVTKEAWQHWVARLRLDEPLEFNEGDVGLAGGIQVKEPASANPTVVDSIRRVGGSTNPNTPWPEEEELEEGDAGRMDRMERVMQRIAKATTSRKRGGGARRGAAGSSALTGSSATGSSGNSEGSDGGGSE